LLSPLDGRQQKKRKSYLRKEISSIMAHSYFGRRMPLILMLLGGIILSSLTGAVNSFASGTAAPAQATTSIGNGTAGQTEPNSPGPAVVKPLVASQIITGCVRNASASTSLSLGGRSIRPGEILTIPGTGVCSPGDDTISWNMQGQDAPKKITGYVASNGTTVGSGFTVTHNSPGHWTINCPAGTFPGVSIPFFQSFGSLAITSWVASSNGSMTVDVNTGNTDTIFWFIIQSLA
jgi:hypothetical protein